MQTETANLIGLTGGAYYITMPKMDGIAALEKIMAFDKTAKVVMISALGKEDLVKQALLLGAKNYIVKPLDRKKVLERIASVLNK